MPGYHNRKKKLYRMGGAMETYKAGGKMPAWLLEKFKKKAEKEMGKGGVMEYDEGGLLEALKRANAANSTPVDGGDNISRNPDGTPRTADGFIIEGDDLRGKLKDVIQASETTNRMGGFAPQVATMKYVTPGKMSKDIRPMPTEEPPTGEEPMEKRKPSIPTKTPPRVPGKRDPFEGVGFDMNTEDGIDSSAVFDRGIAQSGMRGEGTTGGFRGVRTDRVDDGRLVEKGDVTEVADLPEYIREDPTFKNLLEQANKSKYMQDIGREGGKYSNTGGQAARDLEDIMSGRITLDAYKEKMNRASASFGYGGKMKFGVKKKRRGY